MAALTVWFGFSNPARADNLDVKLLNNAPEVMKYLEGRHYQNVGVLKFRVELGKKPPNFNVGPINANLAKRLQNALILVNDVDKPIGILEDPNKEAAEKKLPGSQTPAGREALFKTSFPLAWGNTSVKPDAFLTGVVKVDANMRQGAVVIECFDAANPKHTADVLKFDFATDRTVLADLGQVFALKRGVNVRDEDEGDKLAADDAAGRQNAGGPAVDPKPPLTDAPENPIKLEILYDGGAQELAPDKSTPGGSVVPEPQEQQKVAFGLTNTASEKMAVVLKVNGQSTLYREQNAPAECTLWCLEPGVHYVLSGFTVMDNGEKKDVPFKVLSTAESQAVSYTDDVGTFQMTVFRSGGDKMLVSRKVNLRGLASGQSAKAPRPRSLADVQKQMHKVTATRNKRGLIVEDPDAAQATETQLTSFPNPQIIADVKIRYYDPNKNP